jgi:hypothetical protein
MSIDVEFDESEQAPPPRSGVTAEALRRARGWSSEELA